MVAGAGTGKTTVARRARGVARPAGGVAGRVDPRADLLDRGRRGAARAHRGSRRRPVRGARGHHLPRVLRAAAARRGAGGGHRPVRLARHPGRPPGDAARAHRRAAAAPPRPARQPERACSARSSQRIDRLKDELISPEDYGAWAATLGEDAVREREFAAIYAAPRPHAARGGDARLRRPRAARVRAAARQAACARAAERALPPRARRRAPGHELRPGAAAAAAGRRPRQRSPRSATTTRRSTASAAPRRRTSRTSAPSGRRRPWCASRTASARASGSSTAAHAVVAPDPDRVQKTLRAQPGGRPARSPSGAAPTSARQAQAVAAEVERLIARGDTTAEQVCVLVRSVKSEGQAVAVALEERAVPYRLTGAAAFFQRAEVRDVLAWLRLLVDPGDAGAVVRALARAADRAALHRHRALHPDRPPAQARHGRRARRGDRVAADPARGARAHPHVPQALPLGRGGRSTRRGPTSSCTA